MLALPPVTPSHLESEIISPQVFSKSPNVHTCPVDTQMCCLASPSRESLMGGGLTAVLLQLSAISRSASVRRPSSPRSHSSPTAHKHWGMTPRGSIQSSSPGQGGQGLFRPASQFSLFSCPVCFQCLPFTAVEPHELITWESLSIYFYRI